MRMPVSPPSGCDWARDSSPGSPPQPLRPDGRDWQPHQPESGPLAPCRPNGASSTLRGAECASLEPPSGGGTNLSVYIAGKFRQLHQTSQSLSTSYELGAGS